LNRAFEPIDEFLRIWRLKRWRAWRQHDPINLLARYRANLKSLRGIYGSRILSKRLSAVGIKHTYESTLPLPYKALKS
jgi:hypothetical protein